MRAVARIHSVKPNTVLDWLRKAGQHCERLSEYMMQELELGQAQLDELWTFVRKKERMSSEWEQRTPAMAAGLTDHAWSSEELLMCHVPAAPG